jgi:hypothetical protein
VLLDFGGRAGLGSLDGAWGERVRYVAQDAEERLGLSAVLVRPDGFVAWASDGAIEPADAVRGASRWFGAARPATVVA